MKVSVDLLRSVAVRLESVWRMLDALKIPRQGNVENAGKPPARRCSRPPVVVEVVSVDVEITSLAREVFSNVAVDLGVLLPTGGVLAWCRWLREEAEAVVRLTWVSDLVDQLMEWVHWVSAVVDDDESLCTVKQAVAHARQAGVTISSADVHSWIRQSRVSVVRSSGQALVPFVEVLYCARDCL